MMIMFFVLQLEKEVEQNKNVMKISIPKKRETLKLILFAVLPGGEDWVLKGEKVIV